MTSDLEVEVPVLTRIWHEDEVWNFSAFDLPVVAYGTTIEEARGNFEESIQCHFEALKHFGKLQSTADELLRIAADRGFYEARVQPRAMVEKFVFSGASGMQLCAALG